MSALLLEHGPQTATELAGRLGISPAAVRRHLDALVVAGRLEERQTRAPHRGRGRPARRFHLTDAAARRSRTPTTTWRSPRCATSPPRAAPTPSAPSPSSSSRAWSAARRARWRAPCTRPGERRSTGHRPWPPR
nr:helix-turn-helix domain-containing protein [Blastococcus sp. CCUG 61487]